MHSPPGFATYWCKCTIPVILHHSSAVNDLFSFINRKDFSKATHTATLLISEKLCQTNLTHSFFFFMWGIKDAQKEDRQKGNKQSQIIQIKGAELVQLIFGWLGVEMAVVGWENKSRLIWVLAWIVFKMFGNGIHKVLKFFNKPNVYLGMVENQLKGLRKGGYTYGPILAWQMVFVLFMSSQLFF